MMRQRNYPGAEESFAQSITILESLVASRPENIEWLQSLTVTHGYMADLKLAKDHIEEALKVYEKVEDSFRRILEIDSSSVHAQHGIAIFRGKVGDIHLKQGKLLESQDMYELACELDREIAMELDPGNAFWQNGLGWCLLHLSEIYRDVGKDEESKRILAEAEIITASLEETGHPAFFETRAMVLIAARRSGDARSLVDTLIAAGWHLDEQNEEFLTRCVESGLCPQAEIEESGT